MTVLLNPRLGWAPVRLLVNGDRHKDDGELVGLLGSSLGEKQRRWSYSREKWRSDGERGKKREERGRGYAFYSPMAQLEAVLGL